MTVLNLEILAFQYIISIIEFFIAVVAVFTKRDEKTKQNDICGINT